MKMGMRAKMNIRLGFRIPDGALRSTRLRWSVVLLAISFCFSTLPGGFDVGYSFPGRESAVVDNGFVRHRCFTDDDYLMVYCYRYCKEAHFVAYILVQLSMHLLLYLLLQYFKSTDKIA